jgi:hypothetical protein
VKNAQDFGNKIKSQCSAGVGGNEVGNVREKQFKRAREKGGGKQLAVDGRESNGNDFTGCARYIPSLDGLAGAGVASRKTVTPMTAAARRAPSMMT